MKKIAFCLRPFVLALLAALLLSQSVGAAPLSPGLQVIAAKTAVVKSAIAGSRINFTDEDFTKATALQKIRGIKILSLPSVFDGVLFQDGKAVKEGDVLKAKDLSSLVFEPASDEAFETAFDFIFTNAGFSHAITCRLCLLEEPNASPVLLSTDERVTTYENVAYYGSLKAADPENDELTFSVSSTPKYGVLEILDASVGSFRYTPNANRTGNDSFSYTVTDCFGNTAETDKVRIKIEKNESKTTFADMDGHWASNAAIRLVSEGIMEGETDGETLCFLPAQSVSRCDFLVMAMKACGHSAALTCLDTGYDDNDNIPLSDRGYVAIATNAGYIEGVSDGQTLSFAPDRPITRAEAAVILNRMLSLPTPVSARVFADSDTVPAWAESAMTALSANGLLNGNGSGCLAPTETMTRAQCAVLLEKVFSMNN